MRLLGLCVNGILDAKNFLPLAIELRTRHRIILDVMDFGSFTDELVGRYDGLVVGSDWNQNRKIVEKFLSLGKRTVLVQSEGMFIDPAKWYIGKPPITGLACLWGNVHAELFRARGYHGEIAVTGPPRFDIYHRFISRFSRSEIFERLGIYRDARPYVLFLGQFFPKGEFGPALMGIQKQMTEFACRTPSSFRVLIKCHPQETQAGYFSRADIVKAAGTDHVTVVDNGGHTELIEITNLISEAELVVSYSSTASIEAALLGRPSAIFDDTHESPLANGTIAQLPVVKTPTEVRDLALAPVDAYAVQNFIQRFLPGGINGDFTEKTAAAIAVYLRGRAPVA
ncbi:MAG: hypothetical protein INF97_13360 [Roseomonas sp.]|nr:hypothetical protein [Roseomonas sp.]